MSARPIPSAVYSQRLLSAKKLFRASAGAVALAGPLVIGIGHAPAIHAQTQIASEPGQASRLAFEVASVKPHVFARNQFAFGASSGERCSDQRQSSYDARSSRGAGADRL